MAYHVPPVVNYLKKQELLPEQKEDATSDWFDTQEQVHEKL